MAGPDTARIAQVIGRLARERGGVAAIEFAAALPVLLTLVIGGQELFKACTASRKVASVTRTLGDLVTQYTQMSATDVANVLGASAQVMAPYSTTGLSATVSEISTNALGIASVTWSRSSGAATPLPTGQVMTLPAGFNVPGTSIILTTASFSYVPTFGAKWIKPMTFSDHLYRIPRRSTTVDLT